MFCVPISKRICSLGCILLILTCVACFQQCASLDAEQAEAAIKEYDKVAEWSWRPLGKFASDIVGLVMTKSPKALNETLKRSEKTQLSFVTQSISQNLANHIGLLLCVVIGILIALLLLFLPCFLAMYRSTQKAVLLNSVSKKDVDSKSKGFCVFEIFIICIAVAIFGAVIVIIGSIRSYYLLEVPFIFANYTVQIAFSLKGKLLVNHENRLNDVSRSAFDVIMLLHNVNEDVSSDFMERLHRKLGPFTNIASAVKWELVKVIRLLETEGDLYNKFIGDAVKDTNAQVDHFLSSVKTLKNALGKTKVLDPLLNVSEISISNKSAAGYFEPIPTLQKVSRMKIEAGLRDISTRLKQIVIQAQYDPSDLIEKLKHAAFRAQKSLDESTEKYIKHIQTYVKDEDLNSLLEEITNAKTESMVVASIFNLVILVLAVVALVLALILVLVYHCGVCSTNCFRIVRDKNRKVFLRSGASNTSGGILLTFCYIISIFLWLCWLGCVILFFLTSLPLTYCRALNDYSILDMTLDKPELRTTPGWYSLLTCDEFNMTLRQTVIRCRNDTSFVPTIPDPVMKTDYGTKLKSELDFAPVVANFSKEAKKISPDDVTGFDLTKLKLKKLLDDIDISPPFKILESFLKDLKELDATETLTEIEMDAKGKKSVKKLAATARRDYDSLVANVSSALAMNETFSSNLRTANVTVKSIVEHVAFLNWTADALYSSLINESVDLFDSSLNQTVYKLIDHIFFETELAALDYRKSMSICEAINLFYEKATGMFCNILLYPVALCWFGFFLLVLFLLIAVLLSVKSSMFFLRLPKDFQEERPADSGVKGEDLPTRSNSPTSSGLKEYEDAEDVVDTNEAQNSSPKISD